MIHGRFRIDRYDWEVCAYFAVSCYHSEEIAGEMERIGCARIDIDKAWRNMACGKVNNGITYSNLSTGESVFVVGLASKPAQFLNSLTHEIFHLTLHICKARGIDRESEEAAYLAGDIAETIYPKISKLLCNCCKNKH